MRHALTIMRAIGARRPPTFHRISTSCS